ncbi:cytochrome P450 [Xylariaceae sp. FL0662B]|nr:cytochrome P450 [Xylariaceae sp. FL0662B]
MSIEAWYAVGLILSLGIFVLGYQFTVHPLRHFPGPFIAKFSDAYSGYNAIKQRGHLATYANHAKYGSVYRQAPNRLVFNTANALRDIYLNPKMNKARNYRMTQFNPEENIFGTLERERHRQKRKVYSKILSERSLQAFEPTMIQEIHVFLGQLWKAGADADADADVKPVNMSPLCERLTTDIAGQLAFGQPLNTQTEDTNRIFPRAMYSMNGLVSIFLSWPLTYLGWPLLRWLNRKNTSVFGRAVKGIIRARMDLPMDAVHDFYSIAGGDSVEPGDEGLRRSELWAEAIFFLPAGGTTLSAALSAIFFYLSRHQAVYDRLAAEIRTTFPAGDAIESGPQLFGCKYLRAVIDETLRIAPPFTGTFWREPYSSYTEPLVVDGIVIPRDTIVGVNPYCVMHNEAYFPEPFKYSPERWLGHEEETTEHTEGEQPRSAMRAAFAPFALGDTGCLGKAMAYHEISLVIAKTLWYFDFYRAPGEAGRLGEGQLGRTDGRGKPDEYQLYDLAVADHDGPNLVFQPREDYWKDSKVNQGC